MFADRALLRSFLAGIDVTAVCAVPLLFLRAGENFAELDVGKQFSVPFLMGFFYYGDAGEKFCKFREAFLRGIFGKSCIHIRPFILFTVCRVFEVCNCIGHCAAVEKLEPEFCVLFFVVCGLFEDIGDLVISLFSCLRGIIVVLVSCLGLTGKRGLEVCFGFGTFYVTHTLYLGR